MIMEKIDWKTYYSTKEFNKKINESIIKSSKDLEREIKSEKKYTINETRIYA